MPKKGSMPGLTRSMPGPSTHGARLPEVLPAGVLPPEDSRMWQFLPRAVQQGEAFIQDDTRDWFEDRDRKVVISREYKDHPRWIHSKSIRSQMHNAQIISEVHMLARIAAGRPDLPAWVPARMSVKQQQSDLAFRLTKAAREVFIVKGKEALETFAERAPGQFVKFIGATFIPKQIEANVTQSPGQTMDAETADALLEAISAELKRRESESREIATTRPLDYEAPAEIIDMVRGAADTFHQAAEPSRVLGASKDAHPSDIARKLNKVVDLEADVPEETEWD